MRRSSARSKEMVHMWVEIFFAAAMGFVILVVWVTIATALLIWAGGMVSDLV